MTKEGETKRREKDCKFTASDKSHALHIKRNNDDDCGVSRAVVVHRGERFGREILTRGDRRKRRRLVA